ncbi:MAG: RsmD family RNA methyltransferase [Gemmatimonadaceae bacterium]|nr:RsmD family RNA methyltransferase [Gemmatimonadaceae bacterium]
MAELRIVAGEWRGRRIAVPHGRVRPTADRVREAWMSIVLPALPGARVLDLCAGSGALGLEALSRGAEHADLVEQDARVLPTLRANVAALGADGRATVHRADARRFLEAGATAASAAAAEAGAAAVSGRSDAEPPVWDVAFADPPYREGIALALAARWLRAPFAAIFGVEHEAELTLPPAGPGQGSDRRQYGDTAITFYRTSP